MIDSFTDEYRFLSNFYRVNVQFEDILYPSSEHAYQAAKTLDLDKRREIKEMTTGEAKKHGQKLELRPNWEKIKDDVMFIICHNKFTRDHKLGVLLQETGDNVLVEGNVWHDNYWGNCECENCCDTGQNHLGFILMRIREMYRNPRFLV